MVKPPCNKRASLRLKKHKLKNNKFTYSKYLAQKDRSEADLVTKSSVSLSSWPDDSGQNDSSPLVTPGTIASEQRSTEDCQLSFVDTYISLDASDMEERSARKETVNTQDSTDTLTVEERTDTDVEKVLEQSGRRGRGSEGGRKSSGGRKSPGDRVSPRGRSRSAGNSGGSTADLFMKVSNRLSRRLSLTRKHKKPSIPAEASSQVEIEKYLYGKDCGASGREVELGYTDLNYTANNYTRL